MTSHKVTDMLRNGNGEHRAEDFTRLQLIDDEQQFSGKLSEYMQNKWRLANAGFDYDVVAVFG
ncbi:hypothetical protein LPJ71_007150, partial [Coemansia sp. S17]